MLSSTGAAPLQPSLANPRQIAIVGSSGIMYTVPVGRKFVGYFYASSASASYSLTPVGGSSSTQIAGPITLTSQSTTPPQIVLISGTIVSGTGAQFFINGVESDL